MQTTVNTAVGRRAARPRKQVAFGAALLGATLTGTILTMEPVEAHATAELYGEEAHAGGYGHMFLRIPHGCDGGKATDTVTVRIPSGFTSVKPERKDGWKTRIGRNEKGRVTSVTWYDGNLPDDHFEDFGLSVKYPGKHGTYHLPTVQRCGRAELAWDQTAKPGENPHALERPAPRVVVAKVDAGPGAHGTASGKSAAKGIGSNTRQHPIHPIRPDPRGEAVVLSFNGRSTLIADLPATLRGRLATITLESGNDQAYSTSTLPGTTILERTVLDEDGDLMRTYRNVERAAGGWHITDGDAIVVSVGGEELARAVVSAKK